MATPDIRPTTKPVAVQRRGDTTYHLFANGELWTTGEHGFLCGYVMEAENLDFAIDEHEYELRILLAQAEAEFGL